MTFREKQQLGEIFGGSEIIGKLLKLRNFTKNKRKNSRFNIKLFFVHFFDFRKNSMIFRALIFFPVLKIVLNVLKNFKDTRKTFSTQMTLNFLWTVQQIFTIFKFSQISFIFSLFPVFIKPSLQITHRLVWLMTSFNFSWSVDGILSFLSTFIMGRLRKSCWVLSDVSGSLLMGDCDCCRCRRCGYCCLKDVLKFMKAAIDGEQPSRAEFCVRHKWNRRNFFD